MALLRKRLTKKGFIYDIDFTFNGRRIIKSTKTSETRIAKQILDDIKGKIARGTFKLEDYKKEHISLEEYFKKYFEIVKVNKRPSTIKNEVKYADAFVKCMNNRNIESIDFRLLSLWKAEMLTRKKQNGETISPSTFNIHRRFLKAAFNFAIKLKYIEENPFKELSEAKVAEKRLYLYEDEKEVILKFIDDDIKKVHVHKHRKFLEKFRCLVEFLLNTGLRKEEALSLGWKNIDLQRNEIHIEKTKSGRTRVIPLNEVAQNCLKEIGEDLFSPLNSFHVSRKFHTYIKRANLQGLKLHSLRHTFATNLSELGEDSSVIQKLLGHQDIRTTQIYAKTNIERLRSAVSKLDK